MRKITSIILALAFILVAVTGVQMALPHGGDVKDKPAIIQSSENEKNSAVSVSRAPRQASFYPKAAHEWAGYVFIVAGCMHLVFNIKPMQSYLGMRK
jgi:hypothetical protein